MDTTTPTEPGITCSDNGTGQPINDTVWSNLPGNKTCQWTAPGAGESPATYKWCYSSYIAQCTPTHADADRTVSFAPLDGKSWFCVQNSDTAGYKPGGVL